MRAGAGFSTLVSNYPEIETPRASRAGEWVRHSPGPNPEHMEIRNAQG